MEFCNGTQWIALGGVTAYWSTYNSPVYRRSVTGNTGTIQYQNQSTAPVGVTYAAGVVTIQTAGVYRILASATFGFVGCIAVNANSMTLYKNGASTGISNFMSRTENSTLMISTILNLAAGDNIRVNYNITANCSVIQGGNGQFIGEKIN